MELYGSEEEDISGFDTHTILVSRYTFIVSLGLFKGFVDNKKNTEYNHLYFNGNLTSTCLRLLFVKKKNNNLCLRNTYTVFLQLKALSSCAHSSSGTGSSRPQLMMYTVFKTQQCSQSYLSAGNGEIASFLLVLFAFPVIKNRPFGRLK